MKRFLGFVRKEFYHILRDPRTLLILFGMPLVQILLFGYAVTNEIKEARIAILDQAGDRASQAITEKLLASGYFLLADNLTHREEIPGAFESGAIKMAVILPEGLEADLQRGETATVQFLADATDPNTANTLVTYASQIVMDYQRKQLPPGASSPIQIELSSEMRYNPELKGVYLFVPGLITIILMLVSAMMTSISITREKELGNMEVLLVSPLAPMQIILGKVVPYILLAMANAVLILVVGYYVFGVPIVGSLGFLLAEALLFVISALSLGILISTVAKTQQVALLLSLMGLMLPTILLSGFMFPIDNMPVALQVISHLIPARWFIEIVKGVMLMGLGISDLWVQTLILVGFTVFFLGLSIKRFQLRLA